MDKQEILKHLKSWKAALDQVDAAYNKLQKLTNCEPESEIGRALFETADKYTNAISQIVGDENDWLFWYAYDNEFGKKALTVVLGREKIVVKNLNDLAKVINFGKGTK